MADASTIDALRSQFQSRLAAAGTDRAIKALGSQSALARAISVTPQLVSHWQRTGRIPAERVPEVERATGVHRSEMRPDLWPPQPEEAA